MNAPLCFVLMPFKTKQDGGVTIDFDEVYRKIIRPAVGASGMTCVRADEDQAAAIIHKSMFERLMLCPYAVADLSMANANVFYELGIRHAFRPWSTVLISADRFRIPFDVKSTPILRYPIDDSGSPSDIDGARTTITERLKAARDDQRTDSPLFELFGAALGQPDVSKLDKHAFEERIRESERLQQRLMTARSAVAIDRVQADIGAFDGHDDSLAMELLMANRRMRRWQEIIELIATFPAHLRDNALVREQLAIALNRLDPGSPEAELELERLCRELGPTAETLGLLGRVYKDRWLQDTNSFLGEGLRDKAIATYLRGFETDWRNPYPGINALHLIWLTDPHDPRLAELLPVVEYSTLRRIAGGSDDYWDYATMIEVAIYRGSFPDALPWLRKALAAAPSPMEADSTLQTLMRLRDQTAETRQEWDAMIAELQRLAHGPAKREPR